MMNCKADALRRTMGQTPYFSAAFLNAVITTAHSILRCEVLNRETHRTLREAVSFAQQMDTEFEIQQAERLLSDLDHASRFGSLLAHLGNDRLLTEYHFACLTLDTITAKFSVRSQRYYGGFTTVLYFQREIERRELSREAGITYFNVFD